MADLNFKVKNGITIASFNTAGVILNDASGVLSSVTGSAGQTLKWTGSAAVWGYNTFPTSSVTSGTLVINNNYLVDTSTARSLTLPASPSNGDEVHIFDVTGSAATNNITVSPGSLNLEGSVQNLIIDVNYAGAVLFYTGATYGWRVS